MEHNIQGKSMLQGSTKEFPNNTTVTQYFRLGFTNGQIQPSNLALVDGEKQHTFQQLDDISTKIANAILETIRNVPNHNPDGDRVIGVCIQPSDRLITILFGILKAGAAYVPFDITFPEERIGKIVNDCRPLLVICDGKSNVKSKFESVKNLTKVLTTDELYKKISPFAKNGANKSNVGADDTAIVLYTSGSSGEPKGVRLSHKAIFNRLKWQWDQFPFIPTEKCVFKTALTFVDSVPEIFGPLLQGFRLIVFDKTVTSQPPLFMEKLHVNDISRVVVVPSLLKAIFQTLHIVGKGEGRKLLSSVRLWVCSGEALSYDLLKEFFEIFPENFTLCNFYGSTEVMGDVTFVSYSSLRDVEVKVIAKKVPIGYPLANTIIYVLDENLQQVEQGHTGEVFIAGNNLAKGYVGILDSDKFLINPYSKCPDFTKIYRTGDFGSIALLPNGESALMYEGRIDSQIKVRGQRVDLSEIELVISGLESVSKVKVLCHHPGQPDQAVVAYIVPTSQQTTADQLKLEVGKYLREYERPVIRLLDEIPLLVNGKTDRQRLLKMFAAEQANREEFDDWSSLAILEEKLPIAKNLFKIISSVTGSSVQTIVENLDDSFFNIGGTSLNTVVVIVKLREIGYYISIPDFTSAQTMREILMRISPVESEPSKQNKRKQEYSVTLLTEKDKEEVVHIISYSFSRKGDLEAYVNVSYNDFANLIKSIWDEILQKKYSFVVRQASDRKPVAVSLNFDVYDEPSEADCTDEIKYVMDFLESVESKQRARLPEGKGKLLHSFMMGTSEDVDDSERVSLIELMEEQNLLIARKHKFEGIFTTNSNPLTMQIGRDLHGYEILSEYQVNEYVAPDGVKPFGLAPDSFKIICCWKKLL
ncbi:Mycosubtilin synthase subunit C [Orchesella cincta]|uniref:Mycosubtilin synthase subunit C n=1 Tax=Orchesella cincta TaxID=48709 RepID=A0A1D2MC13_ORCCI|nr:Mycosubtilin synthase subunit C [Orchesella cincta]